MKFVLMMLFAFSILASSFAKADAYDDKARAAAAQAAAQAQAKQYSSAYAALTKNNMEMIRRVPRGAAITVCYDRESFFFREDGCSGYTQWNGIQVCSDGYNPNGQNLPPEIVMCHYHLPNGKDCEMYRNSSIKPNCL